ncbi:AsnC family transcriptional regulator [Candidatus Bathyarchaeota archaeon]|nr:AsnC family transcriptional regulator [Candidatus Bathyarchaeota archaeon]
MHDLPKIDSIDIIILKTLLEESRTSFTRIAKDCEITVAAVRKRYKRLWDAGVINGEIMQVNPACLGYNLVADVGIISAIEDEKSISEFLLTLPSVITIHPRGFGKYNLGVTIALTSVDMLSGLVERIEKNPLVNHADTLVWVEASNIDYTRNLVIKPTKGRIKQLKRKTSLKTFNQKTQLDTLDKHILQILMQNSRTAFSQIARETDTSTINVIRRYKALRGNVLTISSITVDLRKFGYKAMMHLFLKVKDRNRVPEVHAKIVQIPNLLVTIQLVGHYDLRAIVPITDFEDAFKLTDTIRAVHGVAKIEFFLIPIFWMWPLNVFEVLIDPKRRRELLKFPLPADNRTLLIKPTLK